MTLLSAAAAVMLVAALLSWTVIFALDACYVYVLRSPIHHLTSVFEGLAKWVSTLAAASR